MNRTIKLRLLARFTVPVSTAIRHKEKIMENKEFNDFVDMVCKGFGPFGEAIKAASDDRLRQIPEILPNKKSVSAITNFENVKTASLLFERVVAPHPYGMPESVYACPHTFYFLVWHLGHILYNLFQDPKSPFLDALQADNKLREALKGRAEEINKFTATFLKEKYSLRLVSGEIYRDYGLICIPIYSSDKNRNSEFKEGDAEAIITILSDIEIVDEENTEWEQILQFRKDVDAITKFRRFANWLDKEMIGKSYSFIEDSIAVKLEDYQWTLKKHGIKTLLGVMSKTLDPKFLLGSSASSYSLAALTSEPFWGILAQAGLTIGKVSLEVAKASLDFEDKKRGTNSEVSFVYDAKKKLRK